MISQSASINRHPAPLLKGLLLIAVLLAFPPWSEHANAGPMSKTIALPSGEVITAEVYGKPSSASHSLRILWLASGFGFHERHHQVARTLGVAGLDVWMVDLPQALFLPSSVQSLRSIPGGTVAELITTLNENGQRPLLMVSEGYGAITALRGIHSWQDRLNTQNTHTKPWLGALLFSPALFTHIPALGQSPSYVPVLGATNIPIYIVQEEKNNRRWYLGDLLQALQVNAPTYSVVLKGVTSLFNSEDEAEATLQALEDLPAIILRASRQLRHHPTPIQAISLEPTDGLTNISGLDTRLTPYRGSVQAVPFSLSDTRGETYNLETYRGKLTLINFWASWCTPCVKEIPSLNNLQESMHGKPFRLVSINYAEDAQRIREFMQQVEVDFPVLIDPQGALARQWKVVALPSTFVIGPDGKIHAGVNAAIHWDTPAMLEQLEQLLPR